MWEAAGNRTPVLSRRPDLQSHLSSSWIWLLETESHSVIGAGLRLLGIFSAQLLSAGITRPPVRRPCLHGVRAPVCRGLCWVTVSTCLFLVPLPVWTQGQPAPNCASVPSAMTCPANTVYQHCMTPCPASCAKFVTPKVCEGPCVEGCASLPGYIYSDTQSLPGTHCGCTTGGIYYKVRVAERPGSPGRAKGAPGGSRPAPVFPSSLPARRQLCN